MNKPKSILVVGDLMIDRNWVVPNRSARSTSQAHDDVPPRKLINPDWQTDILGGAATVARAALAAAPDFIIYLAAAWKTGFEPRDFLSPEDETSSASSPRIRFIQAAVTLFNAEKVRVYEQRSGVPKLVSRDDRDLFFDSKKKIYSHNPDPKPGWPLKGEVGAVIVADFNKGLLDLDEIRKKLIQYKGLPFLLRSKGKANDKVFTKLPWTLALPNREDLARLVELEPIEPRSFRRLKEKNYAFNPSLDESLVKFSTAFPTTKDAPHRSVLVKLDLEGALFVERKFENKNTYEFTALVLPDNQIKLAGIGAGDVLAANLAVNLVNQALPESQLDYSAACIDAVPSATAFCKGATKISHPPDGGKGGWYGVGMLVGKDVLENLNSVKATFKGERIENISRSELLEGKKKQESRFNTLIKSDNIPISISDAKWFLDGFLTVDKTLGFEILRVKTEIRAYFDAQETNARPFVIALCGTPGSGKSALAKALAKALKYDPITGNAAQWTSAEDLFRLCEEIRTVRIKKGNAFVFIDEVDTAVGGEKLYGKLLAPLGDGAYSSLGYTRQLGPVVFLLAGSNEPWTTKKGLLSALEDKKRMKDHPKLLDLVSRFSSPPIEVPALGIRRTDALYLAASQLRERFPGMERVESGVLKLLCMPEPKHGPRSIIEVIRMIGDLKDSSIVTTKDIKETKSVEDAIKLHLSHQLPKDWRRETKRVTVTP